MYFEGFKTMDDNKFLLITFICAIVIFSIGYFAGSYSPYKPMGSYDSSNCNFLRQYSPNDTYKDLLPVNCSNPKYNATDNYWYCEVD